jgi:hypothetical protein
MKSHCKKPARAPTPRRSPGTAPAALAGTPGKLAAVARSISALARAMKVSRTAARAWTRHESWPFSKRGPWNVADVRRWRRATLSDNAESSRTDPDAAALEAVVDAVGAPLTPEQAAALREAAALPDPLAAFGRLAELVQNPTAERLAKLRLILERAASVRQTREAAAGRLIPADEIERGRVARCAALLSEFQKIPRELAPRLVGQDLRSIESLLESRLRTAMAVFNGPDE